MRKTAVLLLNLGSPHKPDKKRIKRFLLEFLSDKRVIERQGLLWQIILRGIILNIRPRKSAKAYQKIWLENGYSPLIYYTQTLASRLDDLIKTKDLNVFYAMRYGEPSIKNVLDQLDWNIYQDLIVLPLYPQYSMTTSASCFDAIAAYFKHKAIIPSLHFIADYHQHPDYINAISQSIKHHQALHGQSEKLLFSYHGLPQSYVDKGDPYYQQCLVTTRLIADKLGLDHDQYQMSFQSRFGAQKWLTPYTDKTLLAFAQEGIKKVQVVCPGFSVDCLETLEEIAIENRHVFLSNGGEDYQYIPCLNDADSHVNLLKQLCCYL
ncbi:ferrochelatase [Facilibium subflavum]|uniref:ferrochelatase n=1 Tax=Facilibium subflavum TaxID=2219058 RepID=UPI000E6589AE|nr:ferrochelatase [Facilibium subflavum]